MTAHPLTFTILLISLAVALAGAPLSVVTTVCLVALLNDAFTILARLSAGKSTLVPEDQAEIAISEREARVEAVARRERAEAELGASGPFE